MMRTFSVAAVLGAILAASAPAACTQGSSAAPGYKAPRTPDGKPDLQGVWTNASVTNLQRTGQNTELIVPDEQAARVQAQQSRGLRPLHRRRCSDHEAFLIADC